MNTSVLHLKMKTIVNSEQFLYQTSQPTFNLVWLCLKNSCLCKWNKVFICNNINIWCTSYKSYLCMTLWQAKDKRIDEDNMLDYARYNTDRWLVVSDPFFSYLSVFACMCAHHSAFPLSLIRFQVWLTANLLSISKFSLQCCTKL